MTRPWRVWIGGVASVVLATTATAWAHYPMLLADRGSVDPGQPVTIEYAIGHPYMNDRYDAPRLRRVRVMAPRRSPRSITADITTSTTPEGTRSWQVSYTPEREGDYVFSFHGEYTERPARNIWDFAKVVIHCRGAQMGWERPVGDPLEIVPLTRPYAIPVGTVFRGQVMHSDRRAGPGMFVEAETYTDVLPDPVPELAEYRWEQLTDPNGCFSIVLNKRGWWVLSVAEDGGPGNQGSMNRPVRRAVLWVFVGEWNDETDVRVLGARGG
ncbi:DUF4198 domain-containing protein [Planctomycetota bacterium]|nr:DUF4198 domain-containing protein [Planctomycetota bacterium]